MVPYSAAVDALLAAQQAVREEVWRRLQEPREARFPGAFGRIPNFRGAERAAERLARLPEWHRARVLKVNPDAPQLAVRARALAKGKPLYVAVARLAADLPFWGLDPATLRLSPRAAAWVASNLWCKRATGVGSR